MRKRSIFVGSIVLSVSLAGCGERPRCDRNFDGDRCDRGDTSYSSTIVTHTYYPSTTPIIVNRPVVVNGSSSSYAGSGRGGFGSTGGSYAGSGRGGFGASAAAHGGGGGA